MKFLFLSRVNPAYNLKGAIRHAKTGTGREKFFIGCVSSVNSQARANFQSRITVSEETFTTSAVSFTLRPPKNRSSTIRALRGSTSASAFSASSRATSFARLESAPHPAFWSGPKPALCRRAWPPPSGEPDPAGYGASAWPLRRRNARDAANPHPVRSPAAGTPREPGPSFAGCTRDAHFATGERPRGAAHGKRAGSVARALQNRRSAHARRSCVVSALDESVEVLSWKYEPCCPSWSIEYVETIKDFGEDDTGALAPDRRSLSRGAGA